MRRGVVGLDRGVVAPHLEHDEGGRIVPGHAQVVGDIAILRPRALNELTGECAELLDGVGADMERGDVRITGISSQG